MEIGLGCSEFDFECTRIGPMYRVLFYSRLIHFISRESFLSQQTKQLKYKACKNKQSGNSNIISNKILIIDVEMKMICVSSQNE